MEKQLAIWILAGLAVKNVEERQGRSMISLENDVYVTNVVGLALIGKLGLEAALELFGLAEASDTEATWDRIASELGLSVDQVNALSMYNVAHPAFEIAERINKDDWTIDALESHPYPQKDVLDNP